MREILFRGKRVDNGEWIEGGYYLEPYTNHVHIVCWNSFGMGFTEYIKVDPSTVGQYTGLKDRNGVRIFEGDVIQCKGARGFICFGAYASAYASGKTHVGFYIEWIVDRMLRIDVGFWANKREVEVIGNVHDDPALLEV